MKFTSETGSEAGKKGGSISSRKKEEVRKILKEAFDADLPHLLISIERLRETPEKHVNAWSQLLPYIAPKLGAIKVEGEAVRHYGINVIVQNQEQADKIAAIGQKHNTQTNDNDTDNERTED